MGPRKRNSSLSRNRGLLDKRRSIIRGRGRGRGNHWRPQKNGAWCRDNFSFHFQRLLFDNHVHSISISITSSSRSSSGSGSDRLSSTVDVFPKEAFISSGSWSRERKEERDLLLMISQGLAYRKRNS